MDSHPLRILAGSRPHPAETENGDGWTVSRFPGLYRVSLIDGLGHGPAAASATAAAIQTLDALGPIPPSEAIRCCNSALHRTRGAVMAIANIDLTNQRLTYAGVGNIEARLHRGNDEQATRFISDRGIVGTTLPTIHTAEFALPDSWHLFLYTDGVRDRFDLWTELDESETSSDWPDRFLDRWGRDHDDATILLITPG